MFKESGITRNLILLIRSLRNHEAAGNSHLEAFNWRMIHQSTTYHYVDCITFICMYKIVMRKGHWRTRKETEN